MNVRSSPLSQLPFMVNLYGTALPGEALAMWIVPRKSVGFSAVLVRVNPLGLPQLLNGQRTSTVPTGGLNAPLATGTAMLTRNVTGIPAPGLFVRLLK